MAKTYKNSSGTYLEKDLVVAIWLNPEKQGSRPNARRLETITSKESPNPIAFPLALLKKNKVWASCPIVVKIEDIDVWLTPKGASREKPLLVPLTIAKSYFGWEEFYIPSEYKEVV